MRRPRRAGWSRATSSPPRSSSCTSACYRAAATERGRRRRRAHPRPVSTAMSAPCSTSCPSSTTSSCCSAGTVRVAPYATFGTPRARRRRGAPRSRDAAGRADGQPRLGRGRPAPSPTALDHALLLEWLCARLPRRLASSAPRGPRRRAAGGRRRGRPRTRATAPPVAAQRGVRDAQDPVPHPTARASRVLAVGVHVLDVHVRHVESHPVGLRRCSSSTRSGCPRPAPPAAPPSSWRSSALDVASIGATGADPLGQVLRGAARRPRGRRDRPGRPRGRADLGQRAAGAAQRRPSGLALHRRQRRFTARRRGPRRGRRRRPCCTSAVRSSSAATPPARLLRHARAHGTVTAVDLLAPGDADMLDVGRRRPAARRPLPAQRRAAARPDRSRRPHDAAPCPARARRRPRRVTAGADGALVVAPATRSRRVPAFDVDVVDTTGLRRRLQRRLPRAGSCAGRYAGGRLPCWATRPRRRSSRGWRPTTATTTSRR